MTVLKIIKVIDKNWISSLKSRKFLEKKISAEWEYACFCHKTRIKTEKKLDSTRRKASEICLRPPLDIYSHTFSR